LSNYGAWELKTNYQRNLGFGLVCSLLVSSSLFLAAYSFSRVQISPAASKKTAVRIKLSQPFLSLLNSSPVKLATPTNPPVPTPGESHLLGDIPIKAPILKHSKGPLFINGGLTKTSWAGVGGQAEDWSDSSADSVIDLDEFDMKPIVLYKVDPKCPELAQRRRITGTVTAIVLVGKNGLVQEVSIKNSSNSIFDEEVLAALRQWVFRPWVERNRSFPFRFTIIVEFVLR
jgi:TonB family protein